MQLNGFNPASNKMTELKRGDLVKSIGSPHEETLFLMLTDDSGRHSDLFEAIIIINMAESKGINNSPGFLRLWKSSEFVLSSWDEVCVHTDNFALQ